MSIHVSPFRKSLLLELLPMGLRYAPGRFSGGDMDVLRNSTTRTSAGDLVTVTAMRSTEQYQIVVGADARGKMTRRHSIATQG